VYGARNFVKTVISDGSRIWYNIGGADGGGLCCFPMPGPGYGPYRRRSPDGSKFQCDERKFNL